MEYSEEVKKLAETLKNSGLSASMEDALRRAENMLGKKEAETREEPVKRKIDAGQTTLQAENLEEKDGIDESPELQEELKKEEVFADKGVSSEEKQETQKNVDYSKEKKIDLSDVFDVNK